MRNLSRLVWVFAATFCLTGVLCAQPPDATDRISGQVVDAETKAPIANARIAVFHNGHTLLQETKAGKNGAFVAANLLDQHQRQATDSYVLLVRADDYAMKLFSVKPDDKEAQNIELAPDAGREFRVTDLKGKPVANASMQLLSLFATPAIEDGAPEVAPKPSLYVAIGQLEDKIAPAVGDEDGLVVIRGLADNVGKLQVRAPGFASMEIIAEEVREKPIQLSRETVIRGRMLYRDTGLPFYHPTPVAKVQSWQKIQLWRQRHIKEDGTFEITDIPSLEMLGDKTLGINLELNVSDAIGVVTGNGMTIRYAPSSYNTFVTLEDEKDGQKKWYISYFGTGDTGVLYEEGENPIYDFFLEPLARIKGRVLLAPGQEPARVSYHDPKYLYGEWNVLTDAEGNFEIFAPEGDVTLKFKSGEISGELLVKELKGHETREVKLDLEKK